MPFIETIVVCSPDSRGALGSLGLESFADFPINPGHFAAGHMPIHGPKAQAYRNSPWYSLIN